MLVLVNLYHLHINHNAHIVLDVFVVGFISIYFKLRIFCYGYVMRVVIECAPTAVKIIYRLWLQKFVPTVGSHSLARVQGMVYIVLSMSKGTGYGYRTGLRVQGMVYIVLSMSKGTGYG